MSNATRIRKDRSLSFQMLDMAAFHRGLRAKLLSDPSDRNEADRHLVKALSYIGWSRRFSRDVVLP